MAEFTTHDLMTFLVIRPRLAHYVDTQLPLYRDKYHDQLKKVAAYAGFCGYLSPPVASDGEDAIAVTERLVWELIRALQDEGIIPNTMPYVTISWYVLHWVFVPFVRMMLAHYHRSVGSV
jgi:hypothetical protein